MHGRGGPLEQVVEGALQEAGLAGQEDLAAARGVHGPAVVVEGRDEGDGRAGG